MSEELSKTQAKRKARAAEREAFLDTRARQNFAIWQQNFAIGKQVYEENKDKMSEEDQKLIEAEIAKNEELVKEYQAKFGIEDVPSEDVPSLDS